MLESNNKYIKALWGIIPYLVILISFIIIACSFSKSADFNDNTAQYYANAVTAEDNYNLVKSLEQKQGSEKISKIFFYVIPGFVIVADIVIIRWWKRENK